MLQPLEQKLAATAAFMQTAERLPTLYSLSNEFRALVDLLEAPDQDEEAISAELQRLTADILPKAYGMAVFIQGLDNKAANLKAEEARLAAKRKVIENTAARSREYTLAAMHALGEDRIDTGAFMLAVRQNPISVEVTDAALVPSEFQRTKIEITVDKVAVRKYSESTGVIVPGTRLVRGESLVLR